MKEKLIIKNFGPIKSVELELSKLNVFIGDQGTGKSTIAKLLIAINNTFFREIFDLPYDSVAFPNREKLFIEHLKLVGIRNYLSQETRILYFDNCDNNNSSNFIFDFLNQELKVEYAPHYDIAKESLKYDSTYIPSERNLAITLADSLYALIQIKAPLPDLFLKFGNIFLTARKQKENFDYQKIIGVDYFHKDGRDFIRLPSGKDIPINDASTGIQGTITLLTVFDYVIKTSLKKELLVIEEPELNCFPHTQYKLMKHFIENNFNILSNQNHSNQLLITTHSPYMLTSLNNLIYAYKIGKMDKEKHKELMAQAQYQYKQQKTITISNTSKFKNTVPL